jgi:hypothetical protein
VRSAVRLPRWNVGQQNYTIAWDGVDRVAEIDLAGRTIHAPKAGIMTETYAQSEGAVQV